MNNFPSSGAGFGHLPVFFGTGETDAMQNAEQRVLSMPTVTPMAIIDHEAREAEP